MHEERHALHALHAELGARFVPFAGYEMPLQYRGGLRAEHLHTRSHAGLFDVSHMGQVRVAGPGLHAALERALPVDFDGWTPGAAAIFAAAERPGRHRGRPDGHGLPDEVRSSSTPAARKRTWRCCESCAPSCRSSSSTAR